MTIIKHNSKIATKILNAILLMVTSFFKVGYTQRGSRPFEATPNAYYTTTPFFHSLRFFVCYFALSFACENLSSLAGFEHKELLYKSTKNEPSLSF
ncbi:hypothetical protein CQA63_08760 [Helicobacter marmotae]|uniref:Uncharacterized protein n=1 Tax=Helicobacter marmotae TaxID=152490 RepID=A0A3D8I2V8_9HELI|nr:hypothetical protein CQA63_08760 [Helicobacter marmotae]